MRPVRFIHTSDVHLDTSFSGSGFPSWLGDRKREAIRGTFRRILEDARGAAVDFVLVAGDLFELERVTPDTFEFLKRQFESLEGIRVFLAPGNHDPCAPGSPYREEGWPPNVHIFDAEDFRSVALADLGVRITGFGFTRGRMDAHHFRTLPVLPADLCNVVVSHGSDLTRVPAGKSMHGPFTIDEIAGKNVRYCALGHYHQQHRLAGSPEQTEAWYPGIPEGRGWDEEGACGYLLVEIDDGGVRVESRPCSRYDLGTVTIRCDAFSTREQIVDAVLERRGTLLSPDAILRVRLEGAPDPRLDLSIAELEERLAGEALHICWENRTHPALDFESIAREKTLRGRFVRMLNERIAEADETDRGTLERARLYGVEALGGREVRLR